MSQECLPRCDYNYRPGNLTWTRNVVKTRGKRHRGSEKMWSPVLGLMEVELEKLWFYNKRLWSIESYDEILGYLKPRCKRRLGFWKQHPGEPRRLGGWGEVEEMSLGGGEGKTKQNKNNWDSSFHRDHWYP